ncbi:MAG: hypothetical protein K6F77_07710 [Lachnospiraceae bacterium]|nr:hypothetical protein [Lachnospiraceae bacterium]
MEIRTKHGKGGGVYIENDWFRSRYFLKQEEVEILVNVIEKLEDENDIKIIRKMIIRNLNL